MLFDPQLGDVHLGHGHEQLVMRVEKKKEKGERRKKGIMQTDEERVS